MLRKAKIEDADQIVRIKINNWQENYRGLIDQEYLDKMDVFQEIEARKEFILNQTNNEELLVYEDGINEILGFVAYKRSCEQNEYDSELQAIYVDEKAKGKGVGKQMIQFVLKSLREDGKHRMILWCLKDNIKAKTFYEKNGGIPTEEMEMEFGNSKVLLTGYLFELEKIS